VMRYGAVVEKNSGKALRLPSPRTRERERERLAWENGLWPQEEVEGAIGGPVGARDDA
jgi:hypothetical protein